MQHQYAFAHGSNVILKIIFDGSLMQNKILVKSVTNFLWSRFIDDATHMWVLDILRVPNLIANPPKYP